MTPHIRPFVPNDSEEGRVVIDPTPGIATAAGYRLPIPAPYDLKQDPQRSANTYKIRAKTLADLSPFLKDILTPEERALLREIQAKSDKIIALINGNSCQAVKQGYEAELEAIQASMSAFGKHNSDRFVSLEERQNSARGKRLIYDQELRRIIERETIPACLPILKRALERVQAQMVHVFESERDLWKKYQVPIEETELARAVRDRVEQFADAVGNGLSGFSGEITPKSILGSFSIPADL
jgi:hypothetical protein